MPPDPKGNRQRTSASANDDEKSLTQAAHSLGLDLQPAQIARLMSYRDLLLKWNKVYNLTAIRDPQEALHQHLLDCLAIVPALLRQLGCVASLAAGEGFEYPSAGHANKLAMAADVPSAGASHPFFRVLDVGSGGGLPGVVLAVLMPNWQVDCVDAVAKKATFIRQVAAELRLSNLVGLHNRVEQLPRGPDGQGVYGLITSRAFATLSDFSSWTHQLLAPRGVWAAMKGQLPEAEMRELPASVDVFHVEQIQVPGLPVQRCLVWMRPNDANPRGPKETV